MSGKQHCFQFVCCNLGVEIILREIVNWGFSVHFVLLGVSWKFHLHFTLPYALAKIIQNGTKFIQQLNPGFKNHRNLDNFRFEFYNCFGCHWFSCEIDFLHFSLIWFLKYVWPYVLFWLFNESTYISVSTWLIWSYYSTSVPITTNTVNITNEMRCDSGSKWIKIYSFGIWNNTVS